MTADEAATWAGQWASALVLIGLFVTMIALLFGAIYFEIRDYWRSDRDR